VRTSGGETIEIACSSPATRLPWEWTVIGGKPLGLRRAVVRRPVDITHESRGRRYVNHPLRALVFGDTGFADSLGTMPLHYAELEAATIEQLFRSGVSGARVTRLSRQKATHRRVLEELSTGDYDVIHFCGHAWFDDREAYFYLWDRIMLGSELAPLLSRRPPALMVLDTHFTAFVLAEVEVKVREVVGTPGEREATPPLGPPRGFSDAAMRCGVACFVGAFGNVGDRTGAELSVAFYAELLIGRTAAEALRIARAKTARTALDAGMFYTVFGYPGFRLVLPKRPAVTARVIAATLAKAKAGWSEPPPLVR